MSINQSICAPINQALRWSPHRMPATGEPRTHRNRSLTHPLPHHRGCESAWQPATTLLVDAWRACVCMIQLIRSLCTKVDLPPTTTTHSSCYYCCCSSDRGGPFSCPLRLLIVLTRSVSLYLVLSMHTCLCGCCVCVWYKDRVERIKATLFWLVTSRGRGRIILLVWISITVTEICSLLQRDRSSSRLRVFLRINDAVHRSYGAVVY